MRPPRSNAFFSLLFSLLILVTPIDAAWAQDDEPKKRESIAGFDVANASLKQIDEKLDIAPRWGWQRPTGPHYEQLLNEIVRRGGGEAKRLIEGRLKKLDDRRKREQVKLDEIDKQLDTIDDQPARRKASDAYHKQRWRVETFSQNTELVFALQRLLGKSDPLVIEVKTEDGIVRGGTREPPVLSVAVKNTMDDTPVWFIFGGNYRSGRLARWRIHVWDDKGHLLPTVSRQSWIGGGVHRRERLKPGEKWDAKLYVRSYVDLQKPGRYKAQVFYHNGITIADLEDDKDFKHLMVARSEPFTFVIEHGPKLRIPLDVEKVDLAKKWIDELNEKAAMKVLLADYKGRFHEYIKPETSQGKLLTMGGPAVPALLNALEDKQLSYRKRAWVLALLYSITREPRLNPMAVTGALPAYSWRSVGGNGSCTYLTLPSHEEKQREFAQQWLRFREEYIDFVSPKDE